MHMGVFSITITQILQVTKKERSLKKVVDTLQQNLVDDLGWWQEQADLILVQVWIQIRPIIELPNKLFSLVQVCTL